MSFYRSWHKSPNPLFKSISEAPYGRVNSKCRWDEAKSLIYALVLAFDKAT